MKKQFVDYNETIQTLRANILKDCSEIIETDSIISVSKEDDVSIVVVGDCYSPEVVKEIEMRRNLIIIRTSDDTETDLGDLETDDMVAIYEFIYSIFFNDLNQ
jgi:hypothetical protein